ncbi:hypothetical protein CC78DRAFT_580536 [Lojkania enalia]|uniref:Uncharacterized protein n=1 Tax=Lojkania enalia TaxID=147567 RepID=A0A9P4N3G8_9PLEO|nr:hypothetical protein CC78DRAFT_580536 [Didymosphaeria enalia]
MPPKRKAAARSSRLESEAKRKRAHQPVPHRRGGMHRVKDEHRTGTHWDDMKHSELLTAIRSPSRVRIYRKDMKKHEMARALAEDDAQRAEGEEKRDRELRKKAAVAKKRKEKEGQEKDHKKKQKEKEMAERHDRMLAKGEGIVDLESSDEETNARKIQGIERFGTLLDDDSFSEDTSTETPTPTTLSPILPHQKLRIFEWPFPDLPSLNLPCSPSSPSDREDGDVHQAPLPREIPYAVMNLVTTVTGETLELPGRTYQEVVGADFAPKLAYDTIVAARNGILIGVLRKAVIESGKAWAARTQVQGWNGHMYLKLPDRTSSIPLADVYAKWRKKRRGKTSVYEKKRKQEKADKKRLDKKQMILEIYASSEFRPPICYIPAYLDFPRGLEDELPRAIDNLFFIRFPGMDLPHYYFWANPAKWQNPTKPNLEWKSLREKDLQKEAEEMRQREQLFEEDARRLHIRPSEVDDSLRPYPQDKTRKKVRKSGIPREFQLDLKQPKTSKFKTALWSIETELFQHGLSYVLYKYRDQWIADGKAGRWEYFIGNLPSLYPSGKLPENPPVIAQYVPKSLAEKIAAIEVPIVDRPVSPIKGDEPWTRDDNAYWDIVDVPSEEIDEDVQQELLRFIEPLDLGESSTPRHHQSTSGPPRDLKEFDLWLKSTSPSYAPPDSHMPGTPVRKAIRAFERQAWEKRFKKHAQDTADLKLLHSPSTSQISSQILPELISQIESMPVAELKWQLYTLMDDRLKRDRYCRVCFEPLEKSDLAAIYHHYQSHRDEADMSCPFCGMEWAFLDSQGSHCDCLANLLLNIKQWKASHIFEHDFDNDPSLIPYLYRRCSSDELSMAKAFAASRANARQRSPASTGTEPQTTRLSKVSFSPVTVGRRISYNNQEDASVETEVSSMGTTSPRKSNLRNRRAANGKMPRKSSLRVDTRRVQKRTLTGKAKGKAQQSTQSNSMSTSSPMALYDSESSALHVPHHRARADPDAAWDPDAEVTSGSDHVPSPYLHHIQSRNQNDPGATFDPHRWSQSSIESLEQYRQPKVKSKKAGTKTTAKDRKAKVTNRKLKDPSYRDLLSPVPSASSYEIEVALSKKSRIAVAGEKAAKGNLSKSIPGQRRGSLTNLTGVLLDLETETPRLGRHYSPAVSNASSSSWERRQQELIEPDSSRIATLSASGASTQNLNQEKRSSISSASAMFRRASDGSSLGDKDFIKFNDDETLPGLDDEDVLIGNPFAPPSKNSKGKGKVKSQSTGASSKGKGRGKAASKTLGVTKIRIPTVMGDDVVRTQISTEEELANRRAERRTTLSRQSFVEPLVLAPARKLAGQILKVKRLDGSQAYLFKSPTPTPSAAGASSSQDKGTRFQPKRIGWARSTLSKVSARTSSIAKSSKASSGVSSTSKISSLPPAVIPDANRSFYDVPYSEKCHIVPPNTPAVFLRRRLSISYDQRSELNARELSAKIGKVKTTRGGLVREVPKGTQKGKPRGLTVSRKSEEKVRSGRVEKRRAKSNRKATSKSASKANASEKAKVDAVTERRMTRARSRAEAAPKTKATPTREVTTASKAKVPSKFAKTAKENASPKASKMPNIEVQIKAPSIRITRAASRANIAALVVSNEEVDTKNKKAVENKVASGRATKSKRTKAQGKGGAKESNSGEKPK